MIFKGSATRRVSQRRESVAVAIESLRPGVAALFVGTMRVMTLTDMRYRGVIGQAIAAVICLVGCSRSPGPNSTREAVTTNMEHQEAKLSLPLERVMVSVTNTITTLIRFRRSSPPPWQDGNFLTFHFRKAPVPGQMEEWVSWGVVNMHSENFFEITRRLKMSSVEVHVLHTGASPAKVQEPGRPERTITTYGGYAVVTDPRIPGKWYLSEPGGNEGRRGKTRIESKTARELRAACPKNFRASD